MQHPLLTSITPWRGISDGQFHIDFLGVKTDPKFWPDIKATPAGEVEGEMPRFGSQFHEWLATIGAARNGREKFIMAELGAGYGAWLVRAAAVIRQSSNIPMHLIGVEGHKGHHAWMLEHFRNNGLDPSQHTLLHGIVAAKSGEYRFLESSSERESYGSRVAESITSRLLGGGRVATVRGYALEELFVSHEYIDLVHMDIQGAELEVIEASLDVLAKKVRVICVGTHSDAIDQGMVKTLTEAGWLPRWVFPRHSKWATMWGIIQFADGCHVWLNSRLLRKL